MKSSTSVLIIIIALLVLWVGITGKFNCFAGTLTCMTGSGAGTGGALTGAGATSNATAHVATSAYSAKLQAILAGQTPPFV